MKDVTELILRRETHSSRARPAIITAIVISLLAIYGLLESMLRVLGQPPWLIDPLTAAHRIADLPNGISAMLLGVIGAVVFLVGLVFFGNAVLPGRRARHVVSDPRVAAVVDDRVVASALARRARTAAGVTREQVMVVVSARTVQVNVRPTSGISLDETRIRAAVEDEIAQMGLEPSPTVTVHLSTLGAIGV